MFGKNVPVNHLAVDADVPRLLYKLYSNNYSKDELSNDKSLMKNFFGSFEYGKSIIDNIDEEEWNQLADSVATPRA